MKIAQLYIENFRSIRGEKIEIENLTMFVGSNGCGKSSFLKALNFFYEPKIKVTKEDFFNRDTSQPIRIEVTYTDLSAEEVEHFAKYLTAEGKLIVTKRFIGAEASGAYFGILKKSPELAALQRKPVDKLKEQYSALRSDKKFADLPEAKTGAAIEDAILAWEEAHPEHLDSIESETQFFGFENSSAASLERFTKFVYIPAVMMETHLEDSKNGPIGELTDILARHQLKEDAEIKALEAEIKQRFSERLRPFNANQMSSLSQGITDTIQAYYKDVGVKIELDENVANVNLPIPKAVVTINESGYSNPISSAGQGLQRAFVLSLLQYFANHQPRSEGDAEALNLILGIDEPELYQHPSKQKLFYSVLKELSTKGSVVAANVQCCYTTHSPLMLNIEDFNHIIRVAKEPCDVGDVCETKIYKSSLQEIANKEASLPSRGRYFTELKTLAGLINAIDSRINEGFFSKTVVLVEGASDIIALRAAANSMPGGPVDLEKLDVAVIDCGGKNNLEKPQIVFNAIGINTYCVWDSDYKLHENWLSARQKEQEADDNEKAALATKASSKKDAADAEVTKNRDLCALHGESINDWPDYVGQTSAAHKDNLETTLKTEIGQDHLEQLIQKHNSVVQAKSAWKNPLVMKLVLDEAFSEGRRSAKLDEIVRKIIALNQGSEDSGSAEEAEAA